MISHSAPPARASTPSAAATAHVSATASSSRRRQSGSLRSSPIGRWVSAVAAATGACRASFSQSTAASLPSIADLGTGPAEQLDRLRAGVGGDRHHDVAACSARSRPGRSSQASIRPMLAPTTRAVREALGGASACARCRSAAGRRSRPAPRTRPSASSSAGAFTVTSRRSTGSLQLGRHLGPHRLDSGPCLRVSPSDVISVGRVRAGDADDADAGAHEPDGEHAADCARAEDRDRSRLAPDRRSG